MTHKNRFLFFIFFVLYTSSALSCNWCNAYKPDKKYTYEAFFMKLYFEKCQPSAPQLIDFFKTMCIKACTESLKKTVTLLGDHPDQYFHTSKKSLEGKQLVQAVKTFDQLLQFIHSYVINPKTKMLIAYQERPANTNYPFFATYLKEYAQPDQYGCTVLDDLHAQSLSYSGALFNSFLLKHSIEINDQTEQRQLVYLFTSLQYLVSQLRNSPYQQSAEKALEQWTRLYATIEKEQKQLSQKEQKNV